MKFSDIIGHDDVKRALASMVDAGRMPHAIMLGGPSGVGKMMMARALAQYIHCSNRHDGDSCGVCPSCRRHQTFNAVDLRYSFPVVSRDGKLSDDYADRWREYLAKHPYMEPEEWNNAIDAGNTQPIIYSEEANEIIRRLSLTATSEEKKIQIIWQPEKLNEQAANKLLKIIEEPASDTVFILVSNNPSAVLPTIFSRTQRFNMNPLEEPEIVAFLMRGGMSHADAAMIAPMADGSIIKADEMAGRSNERKEFDKLFQDLMRTAYSRKPADVKRVAAKMADLKREKSRRWFAYCALMIRENFISNLRVEALNRQTPDEKTFSSRFAPFINSANVEAMIAETDLAARDIERNANAKIVCFDYLLKLMSLIRKKP